VALKVGNLWWRSLFHLFCWEGRWDFGSVFLFDEANFERDINKNISFLMKKGAIFFLLKDGKPPFKVLN